MKLKLALTTCLTGVFALSGSGLAWAQTAPEKTDKVHTRKTASTTASKQHSANAKQGIAEAKSPESIIVLGSGAARETQTISHNVIQQYVPGTSPFKALSKLPGVMFTTSDPLGSYEWSQQIIIRGFDQSRLGFTMDGIPLGNLSYGNDNGLSIGRALQTENNGPATLSQGAGSVGVAASNDLGGALEFTSIDPTRKFGADVAGTVGSSGTWRTFARINSGELKGGGRFYVSYNHQDANKWKGDGVQKQDQANAKYIQPFGEHVKLTVFGDWSKRAENDYQDISLAQIKKYGYNLDNITGNYALAKQIGYAYQNGTAFPSSVQNQDTSYFNAAGLREDALGYGRLDFDITSRLKGYVTGYGHTNTGEGAWVTPYLPTPTALGGSPLSTRTTEYDIHRAGFIGGLTYKLANHTIEGGFWFENNNFEQARRFYPLNVNGAPSSTYWYQGNSFYTQWQSAFNTKTYQVHLGDTWQILPALKVNYGFKSLIVDNTARAMSGNYLGTPTGTTYPSGSLSASNGFLPQIGANYRLDHNNEIFADYSRNMAAFDSAQTSGPFSTTTAGFQALQGKLKPEMSNTEELGYRFHNRTIQASITGYYVEFANRLLSVTQGVGILGNASVLTNVGGVTARGVDMAFNWRFAKNWSLFASYAFNNSFYDNNVYADGQISAQIKNKNVVGMPRNLANVQLGYDDGRIWGNVLMQFQDRRYYTYTNDASVPANDIFNLNVGYRFQSQNWFLRGVDAQINVTNLFDKRYVATVGSTGFVNSDPNGTVQTLQAGAPRMVFFTLRKHFD
ncbi:TonB-dependent receptor [Gluconobacter wancherniae]|uniref:TonB-dependent receptor n=1 Tax=Gluconobacter wancherniae NBRC 103581 TaxID=656744 RepID=A0A511AYQ6_9PROT|nr:TonB-dependent receptor [Gluconobacter wancherniae]MBF0852616.1 TonB-dependent receptor [Gluconobacter wancherniae]MBS1087504.1 TonB-dependent receptor [Gluconobacter wancherniae]MBS1093187.1 TonB-dependent receptor [Gluconobacter wancherniae]GBD56672.1 TonB-dependent receptor [Gluconobacter wancherniae NBRC 103581]GBR64328.1 TonB-dependent receptor [Gluconobacter wancherniae NBRC 103581]